MKRAFFYITLALGIFSASNSFAREAKTLKFLLDIPQDFCLHAINSPIINQNNSPVQNLYFDVDMTEEDNDDMMNSDRKKCSFGKIFFNLDPLFSGPISNFYPTHTTLSDRNYISIPPFYFNSPIVLRV